MNRRNPDLFRSLVVSFVAVTIIEFSVSGYALATSLANDPGIAPPPTTDGPSAPGAGPTVPGMPPAPPGPGVICGPDAFFPGGGGDAGPPPSCSSDNDEGQGDANSDGPGDGGWTCGTGAEGTNTDPGDFNYDFDGGDLSGATQTGTPGGSHGGGPLFPMTWTGYVAETPVDFRMPSKGLAWSHVRYYNQYVDANGSGIDSDVATGQGYCWSYSYWWHLEDLGGGQVRYWHDLRRSYTYDMDVDNDSDIDDGTFVWEQDMQILSRLIHNHAADPDKTFRLQKSNGLIWLFYDFDSSWGNKAGKIWKVIGLYGGSDTANEIVVNYDSNGYITYITDPSGHYIYYTWITSGNLNGLMSDIKVRTDSATTDDSNVIAHLAFTYKDGDATSHADCGSTKDLILVEVKTRDTNDTTTLGITRTTHYRYWKGTYSSNSGDGQAHQLRYICRPRDAYRCGAASVSTLSASNATIAPDYVSSEFKYYDTSDTAGAHRVKSEEVFNSVTCCGSGGLTGTYSYSYALNGTSPTDRNDWVLQTKETRPDTTTRWVETNQFGQPLVSAIFQSLDVSGLGDSGKLRSVVRNFYDTTSGRLLRVYTPSAVTGYNASTHSLTYENAGFVMISGYESASNLYRHSTTKRYTYAEVTSGGAPTSTEGVMLLYKTWISPATWSYRSNRYVDEVYVYPAATYDKDDTGSRVKVRDYDYVMYTSGSDTTDRIRVMKTTYPVVATTQNGSGTATAEYFYYDEDGQLRWRKDGEGRVTYATYDKRNGMYAIVVNDVLTGTTEGAIDPSDITSQSGSPVLDWSGAAPEDGGASPAYSFRTSGTASDFVRLITKWSYDTRGRVESVTAPDGQISYVAHLDNETRVYPSWDSGNTRTRLPVVRVLTEFMGTTRVVTRQAVTPTSITYGGTPHDGSEYWPSARSDWTAWSKAVYDADGRLTSSKVWHDIPSSGDGSAGANYYETTYDYVTQTSGLVGLRTEVHDPANGWTRIYRNIAGQVTAVYKTAQSSTPSDGDYKKVAEYFYGQTTAGTGESLGGRISAMREYYGSGSTDHRETRYFYDSRGLLNYVGHYGGGSAAAPHMCYDHDNMGRVTAVATYKTFSSTPTTTSASTTTDRVTLSKTYYDTLHRVYLTEDYSIASNGTIDQISSNDKKLVTRYFYDRRNQLVAVDPPDSGVLINKPDGMGRIIETWVCSEMDHTAADVYSSGAFNYANSDIKVIEKTVTMLNALGNPAQVTHRELNHDDTEMSSGDSDNVATYTYSWYDEAGRPSASAYYGTNQSTWATTTGPSFNPLSIPSRSDSILVTSFAYDSAGRLQTVTDPKAIVTAYTYDDLGRPTLVTEDSGGLDRQTAYTYDGLSNVATISAKAIYDYNGGGVDDQVTEYKRENSVDPNWVTEIRYPNPGTGAASSSTADKVVLTYNRDGTLASRTDQNTSVIDYTYDERSRLTDQTVSTLGGSTDGSVRRIINAYNTSGRLEKVTSWPNTGATGTRVNEVKFTYDGFGMLISDEQAHDGATGSAPTVSYSYAHSSNTDESTYQNYFDRLQNIQYPNGRYVWYVYDAHSTSGIGTINNYLSRVGRIADGDGSSASRAFAEYSYNGLGRMVQRDHLNTGSGSSGKFGNKTALRFIKQTGASGATYPDFDRFGRLTTVRHLDYNASGLAVDSITAAEAVRFNYSYDRNSNRLSAESIHNQARSQIYSYDNLNRLGSAKLGEMASATALTSEWDKPSEQSWTLDLLGNWSTLTRSTGASSSANETRTHNATNEIDTRTVAYETARFWVDESFGGTDTNGWSAPDLDTSGSDGTWGNTSNTLRCSATANLTGHTGSGMPDWVTSDPVIGAIYLIDKGQFQDAYISCSATLTTGCQNAGIVFGYVDAKNFWVRVYSLASQKIWVYQVVNGVWSQKNNKNQTITSNVAFTMEAIVGSGRAQDYDGEVPLGKIGLWVSDGSNNSFDNFKVRNTAGPYEVDGRWFCDKGDVRIDDSNNNKLETTGVDDNYRLMVRRGFLGDQFVLEYTFKYTGTGNRSGALVRWLDNDNWIAVHIGTGASPVKLVQRKNGGTLTTIASNSTIPSMTTNTEYNARVVIGPSATSGQNLKFYIDGDQDGFSDESPLINSDTIDDDWDTGYVGLFRAANDTTTHTFDNFKVGYDNNADGDIADSGDDIQIDDNFDAAALTLAHDAAGNLTDDGVFLYVYDAWNRLVKVTRRLDAHTPVAEYEYDGLNRRVIKIVENCGDGIVPGSDDIDGNGTADATGIPFGDRSEHYYYAGWRVIEERDNNGSAGRVLAQTVYGTEYIDEPVCRDRNLDVSTDSTPAGDDCLDTNSTRYFYHQDANYRVAALTNESGTVIERYEYEAYGEPRIYAGRVGDKDYGSGALVNTSHAGNPLTHQGLRRDDETGLYENRYRKLDSALGRFCQPEPLGYADGISRFQYERSSPFTFVDYDGRWSFVPDGPDQPPRPTSVDPPPGTKKNFTWDDETWHWRPGDPHNCHDPHWDSPTRRLYVNGTIENKRLGPKSRTTISNSQKRGLRGQGIALAAALLVFINAINDAQGNDHAFNSPHCNAVYSAASRGDCSALEQHAAECALDIAVFLKEHGGVGDSAALTAWSSVRTALDAAIEECHRTKAAKEAEAQAANSDGIKK